MLGLIYLMVVAGIAIVSCVEYEQLRKKSRNDAMKRGHMDYVDYKGQQWFGDRRAAYKYENGKEYLVDLKKPDVIYIDITEEKKRKEENNPLILRQKQKAYKDLIRCCGSIWNCRGQMRTETENGAVFELDEDYGTYYYQLMRKDGSVFLDDGVPKEISKERYDFLKGKSWNNDTQEEFLARKKYMDENRIFEKCGYGHQNAYRIDMKKDPAKREFLPTKTVFFCAKTEEEAKQLFMKHWYKYCRSALDSSITVTQIH